MKGMSKFQLILTGVFGLFIVVGVLVFAFGQTGGGGEVSRATVWGTMSQSAWSNFIREAGLNEDKTVSIKYVSKDKETFDQEFIEALASGTGPDLFFLPQDSILRHEDKIYPIPFDSYSERKFTETFLEEGELYLAKDSILALPFMVDPMVMYWNRDTFSNAGISAPPRYWSEMYDVATKLTVKDVNLNISRTALALGEHSNVSNVNELISLLVMQAGSPITNRRQSDGVIENLFNQRLNFAVSPALRAINFYTEFSNPLKPFYSWNRSLPISKNFFLSGDAALYFGFASELADIRLKNPNLNFGVSAIPQTRDTNRTITFGRMVGLAIPRNSKSVAGAYNVALALTSPKSIAALSKVTNLPPVRRDLLSARPSEAYQSVFYDGAIQARGWISPEPARLNPIFKEMIESVTAGRAGIDQVLSRANQQIDALLK